MNKFNIVTGSDSYKFCHSEMYPENTQNVYSYFESRKGARFGKTLFFGLQGLIKDYLQGVVVTKENIDTAEKRITAHIGPNLFHREKWDYIVEKHGGKLPLRIRAVKEGTLVPVDNVLMDVEATDEKCFWLTNYVETLLTHVWFPSTVATLSKEVKDSCLYFLNKSADKNDSIAFMLHDFGFRGTSSFESASTGGAGHLVNFMGTDTFPAIEYVMDNYNTNEVVAYSVAASEHSINCALGLEGEALVIKNLLDKYPTGILSVVSDSFDIFNCVENIIGGTFRDRILAREGKFVVRPDSGDPLTTTLRLIEILGDKFGVTYNSKGYKVLNPKIGLIWGDGIDIEGINIILNGLVANMWSAENIVFGMGGGLLQKVNRDTQRFAFKSAAQKRDGIWHDVYKNPLDQSKASKRGKLKLIKKDGKFMTVRQDDNNYINDTDLLELVFENGEVVREMTFQEIRDNSNK